MLFKLVWLIKLCTWILLITSDTKRILDYVYVKAALWFSNKSNSAKVLELVTNCSIFCSLQIRLKHKYVNSGSFHGSCNFGFETYGLLSLSLSLSHYNIISYSMIQHCVIIMIMIWTKLNLHHLDVFTQVSAFFGEREFEKIWKKITNINFYVKDWAP